MPSQDWARGSTRAWRRTRALVLQRDGYTCRLQLEGCTRIATHGHHTHGRSVTGDDPAYVVAACEHCNLQVGDPTRPEVADPAPRTHTQW